MSSLCRSLVCLTACCLSLSNPALADLSVEGKLRPTLDRMTLTIGGDADEVGQSLTVTRGGEAVATIELASVEGEGTKNGAAAGEAVVSFAPTDGPDSPAFVVRRGGVEGEVVGEVAVPDTLDRRLAAVKRAEMDVHPVFSQAAFPAIAPKEPGWIETLLGPYELDVRYFDNEHVEVTEPSEPGRYAAIVTFTAAGFEPIRRYVTVFRTAEPVDWPAWKDVSVGLPGAFGVDPAVAEAARPAVSELAKWELADRFEHGVHAAALAGVLSNASPTDAPFEGANVHWNADEVWWIDLKKKLGLYENRYLTYLPEGYTAESDKRWPVVLYLHGAGPRGQDLDKVRGSGLAAAMEGGLELPAVVVAPQADSGAFWVPARVEDLLDELAAKYAIDPERVIVTGDGMGAYGSWFVASFYPQRFAGVVPVGGGGEAELLGRIVEAGVPAMAFVSAQGPGVQARVIETFNEMGGQGKVRSLEVSPGALPQAVYGGEAFAEFVASGD